MVGTSREISSRWMTLDLTDDKSALGQVMAWCHMSTLNCNDGVKSAKDADNLSSWAPLRWVHCSKQCPCKDIHLCMAICQQKLQAGLDIHEGLTAQKYIDEIVRPHFMPRVDTHALADSTVFMRDGAKPHATRISQDVLANATNLLLPTNNPDISIIASLWSIVSRNIIGMNPSA